MAQEEYSNARKLALRQYRKDTLNKKSPFLTDLDSILKGKETLGEEYLGFQNILISQIKGTRDASRTNAFGSTFLPLIAPDSEFAIKWNSLYNYQIEEGIQEPIIVYEYMNDYYVREGNKRVSVLRYLENPDIDAYVTRILPADDQSAEYQRYQEFLYFYQKTKLSCIVFSEKSSYQKLETALGKDSSDVYTEEELDTLKSCYLRFRIAYRRRNSEADDRIISDKFLVFINMVTYEVLKDYRLSKMDLELKNAWAELNPDRTMEELAYDLQPSDNTPTLLNRFMPSGSDPLKIAFVYDRSYGLSSWTYAHELGRTHIESVFSEKVITTVYENAPSGIAAVPVLEQAIDDGNTVIFTTSPTLMPACANVALNYKNVNIINCSLSTPFHTVTTYFARQYEIKFLLGVIAGSLTETNLVGYEADYPVYGTTASINAFALGVQMTNPSAKVELIWKCLKEDQQFSEQVDLVSARHLIKAPDVDQDFGLYQICDDRHIGLATGLLNWGTAYEHIIQKILNGRWKQKENLWWGLSGDVTNIILSSRIPVGTARLVDGLKQLIKTKSFYPFEGELKSQNGTIHGTNETEFKEQDIIYMDWLYENIIGSIPAKDELNEAALEVYQLQGIKL